VISRRREKKDRENSLMRKLENKNDHHPFVKEKNLLEQY